MSEPSSRPVVAAERQAFIAHQLLFPNRPEISGRFGDDIWDIRPLRRNSSESDVGLDLRTVPERSSLIVREILMAVLNPVAISVRWKPPARTSSTLANLFRDLRWMARWADERGKAIFDLTQQDVSRFLIEWHQASLAPSTIRGRIQTIRLFRTLSPALTHGLQFEPWPGRSAAQVAGERTNDVNETNPIPWSIWSSIIEGAWLVIDRYSSDIIAAEHARREILAIPSSGPVAGAAALVARWRTRGGLIPLHTGYEHRGRSFDRGTPNMTLLARQTRIHSNRLRLTHRIGDAALIDQVQRLALQPAHSAFGSVFVPTVFAPSGDLWMSELGSGEIEYLVSVLRAAVYVLVAALTGMRDSEIQSLERGAISRSDGLTSIRSTQTKGVPGTAGRSRTWWIPEAVVRAVEVLENLSPHRTLLFARSGRSEFSDYQVSRDIPRLLGFLSAEPESRPGRGTELGHTRVPLVSAFTKAGEGPPIVEVNQRSLRQSFSVWAARKAESELGLGIQLGHASLKQTFGYAVDRREAAVRLLDDERGKALNDRARSLLTQPVTGPLGENLASAISTLTTDQFESLVNSVAQRLHIGVTNDCVYDPSRARCGTDGPQLHSHNCAVEQCQNCLIGHTHAPIWRDQVERLDDAIARTGNVILRGRLIDDRRQAGRVLASLDGATDASDEKGSDVCETQ